MAAKGSSKLRPDFATIGGVLLAAGGILGGLLLEGGSIGDILQHTAAMIVLGGTLGAVMVNTPMATLKGGLMRFSSVLFEKVQDTKQRVDVLVDFATKARKQGVVSLEAELAAVQDPFLRKAVSLAIDGADLQDIRAMLDLEIGLEEHRAEQEAKVFESAGGYAPTIGIIGAVLGLIQVMKNLSNVEEVGHGIAVAFVATVYGVAISNLLFLPAANKMKARARQHAELMEMTLEGITGIVEGMNPKLLRMKLEPFVHEPPVKAKKK